MLLMKNKLFVDKIRHSQ